MPMRDPHPFQRHYGAAGALLTMLLLVTPAIGQPAGDPAPGDSTALQRASEVPFDLDVVSLGLEFVTSPGEGDFFAGYRQLGGITQQLSGFMMPTASLRIAAWRNLKIVISGSYASAGFVDIYGVRDTLNGTVVRPGGASLVEDVSVMAVPVTAGVEFTPIQSQFSSYVGVAVGGALNDVTWSTTTREQTFSEFYRPTTNLKGLGFSPVFRIYAGVDLRFDRYLSGRSAFRGIFLEGSYLMLPVARDYFSAIRSGGRGLPRVPNSDGASMNLGGLTFTLGINLQYARR